MLSLPLSPLLHLSPTHKHSLCLLLLHTAYYRGAMGILLLYDVTDEASFNNIRNWMRNIEQHASDNVNKVGVKVAICGEVLGGAHVWRLRHPHACESYAHTSMHAGTAAGINLMYVRHKLDVCEGPDLPHMEMFKCRLLLHTAST